MCSVGGVTVFNVEMVCFYYVKHFLLQLTLYEKCAVNKDLI